MLVLRFHDRLRRLDLGLMQRTLGIRFGAREQTVHLWETGRARPLPRAYCRIVRFLGYDPEEEPGTLAGRLRSLRRRLGPTQRELAVRLGLDEGTVVDLESRRRM